MDNIASGYITERATSITSPVDNITYATVMITLPYGNIAYAFFLNINSKNGRYRQFQT